MSASLGELAVRFGCELRGGDPDHRVGRVDTLERAGPDSVAFIANPKYLKDLAASRAGLVILDAAAGEGVDRAVLIAPNPHAVFARVAVLLHPDPHAPPGIHPSAWVAPLAQVAATAHVGPHVSIGRGAIVGERAYVGPGCVIEEGATIGDDVRLLARVVVCARVRIGARSVLQPGCVIGADGFGYAEERKRWIKVPQLGSVVIGEDVEIGANTTVDRGAIDDTVIEEGVKLDNQIQIGHNVRIGAHTAMAACSGVSGSSSIGSRCQIGGMVGIAGHLEICDDVAVTGLTMVSHSIREPGVYSSGLPAVPAKEWRRAVARIHQLDALARKIRKGE